MIIFEYGSKDTRQESLDSWIYQICHHLYIDASKKVIVRYQFVACGKDSQF
jgi:hypothetical protein